MRSNKTVASVLLLVVIVGAILQVSYWNAPRGAGERGIGQSIMAIALILLAIFAPQYSRALQSFRYDRRFNTLIGLIVIAALAIVIWVLYSRYYGPLIQFTNSDIES